MIVLSVFFVFFFFKQKTAYEMRISDWSSDVCSSDLRLATGNLLAPHRVRLQAVYMDHRQRGAERKQRRRRVAPAETEAATDEAAPHRLQAAHQADHRVVETHDRTLHAGRRVFREQRLQARKTHREERKSTRPHSCPPRQPHALATGDQPAPDRERPPAV